MKWNSINSIPLLRLLFLLNIHHHQFKFGILLNSCVLTSSKRDLKWYAWCVLSMKIGILNHGYDALVLWINMHYLHKWLQVYELFGYLMCEHNSVILLILSSFFLFNFSFVLTFSNKSQKRITLRIHYTNDNKGKNYTLWNITQIAFIFCINTNGSAWDI